MLFCVQLFKTLHLLFCFQLLTGAGLRERTQQEGKKLKTWFSLAGFFPISKSQYTHLARIPPPVAAQVWVSYSCPWFSSGSSPSYIRKLFGQSPGEDFTAPALIQAASLNSGIRSQELQHERRTMVDLMIVSLWNNPASGGGERKSLSGITQKCGEFIAVGEQHVLILWKK